LGHHLFTCGKSSIVVSRVQANSECFMNQATAFPQPPRGHLVPNPKARLKEQFHEVCRFKHLALRSEEAYWGWVVRLVRFFESKVNPRVMTGEQLAEFLTHLAAVDKVAASTQNQALNALVFLYREVLNCSVWAMLNPVNCLIRR
jgi:hypothetical protein